MAHFWPRLLLALLLLLVATTLSSASAPALHVIRWLEASHCILVASFQSAPSILSPPELELERLERLVDRSILVPSVV